MEDDDEDCKGEQNKYPHYVFYSKESYFLWKRKEPLRLVDWSLGWPVLVTDEDGEYVEPPRKEGEDEDDFVRCVRKQIREFKSPLRGVDNRKSGVHGTGVFAMRTFSPGYYIGPYGGTVMTDEEQESINPDGQYVFVLHNGANGVVVDGEVGPTNALKHINHSCEPNAKMMEVYEDGTWHVAVVALKNIEKGCEITHDYEMTTEDSDDPRLGISCTCGSRQCRGRLFMLREW